MTLFPLGGNRLVAMDFVGPDVEPEEVKEAVRRRRRAILYALPNAFYSKLTRRRRRSSETEDATQVKDEKSTTRSSPRPDDIESNPHTHDISTDHNTTHSQCLATALTTPTPRHVSFRHDVASTHGDGVRSHIHSPTPTEVGFSAVTSPDPTVVGGEVHAPNDHEKAKEHGPTDPSHLSSPATPTLFTHISQFLKKFLSSLITPASLSILLSFPIALIPPLKGLFVALPASNSTSAFTNPHISPAPDGLPPLSVILDTATFVGAASVPLGLICLGSALARLKVPRNQWSTLPTGAIASLAIGKMLIAPILGVGIVQGLVKCGLIGKEDKLLQFVCM
ncbi:hypothetical protein H0H93_004472 [Arthromyces matolae]|nr:hypothetical protein H0H93_004472 [Arthromyces matolae]